MNYNSIPKHRVASPTLLYSIHLGKTFLVPSHPKAKNSQSEAAHVYALVFFKVPPVQDSTENPLLCVVVTGPSEQSKAATHH